MVDKMEFSYSLIFSDYLEATVYLLLQKVITKIYLLLSIFGLLLTLIASIIWPEEKLFINTFIMLILIIISVTILEVLIAYYTSRNKLLHGEQMWNIDKENIIIRNYYSETKLGWNAIDKTIETKNLILLRSSMNSNCIFILPKRSIDQEAISMIKKIVKH